MRHLKSVIAIAFVAATLGHAAIAANSTSQAPTPAPAAAPVAKAPPTPMLWKVSDKNNAVYLLGSFHLLKADDYPLSGDIDAAFVAAEKVLFEVPPEAMDDPAVAQQFLAAAGYADGRTLSKVLPAELVEKLNRILAKGGASAAQLDAYEPWFVNLSMMLGVAQAMGFRPDQGLDKHLMKRAADAGKTSGGLETMEQQLQLLDSSPMTEQIAGLKEFLDDPQRLPGQISEMHDAWRSGDVAKLDQLARVEMKLKTPETYKHINLQRNDAWVPKIRELLDKSKRDDTLVVVGSLHLLGDDGVVEKLRASGYKVERVCSACAAKAVDTAHAVEGK